MYLFYLRTKIKKISEYYVILYFCLGFISYIRTICVKLAVKILYWQLIVIYLLLFRLRQVTLCPFLD